MISGSGGDHQDWRRDDADRHGRHLRRHDDHQCGRAATGHNNVLPNTTVNVNVGGASGTEGLDRNTFSDTIGARSKGGAVFGSGTLTLGGTVTSSGTSQMSQRRDEPR